MAQGVGKGSLWPLTTQQGPCWWKSLMPRDIDLDQLFSTQHYWGTDNSLLGVGGLVFLVLYKGFLTVSLASKIRQCHPLIVTPNMSPDVAPQGCKIAPV